MRRTAAYLPLAFCLLTAVGVARAQDGGPEEELDGVTMAFSVREGAASLDGFYDRLAADLRAGRPMVATVHVALCDNDSQGIIPVKNRKICNGDDPAANMYWGTRGGLFGWTKRHGWKRVHRESSDDVILETVVWKKTARAGGALRERGVEGRFDSYLVGLAYRGREIRRAMIDYLHAVNHDTAKSLTLSDGRVLTIGPGSHVVGYIGHNYMMDVDRTTIGGLLDETGGESTLHKATFALACVGDVFIRPFITRGNAYVLLLNRQLTFPGAWTVGGILDGIAAGNNPRRIHIRAARAFAIGMKAPPGSRINVFAHGPEEPR